MRKLHRASIVILALLAGSVGALAGTHIETFQDYLDMDPVETTARWNIQAGRLELPPVETYQIPLVVDLEPYPGGGSVQLTTYGFLPDFPFFVNRLDDDGNSLWEEPGIQLSPSVHLVEASLSVLSDGDILVVYHPESLDEVLAQRLNPQGAAVWGAPVQVNQGSAGAALSALDCAPLPDGAAVVVWRDARGGNYNVYGQALDASGTVLWGGSDVKANPAGVLSESSPAVTTDPTGRIFVGWLELTTSYELRLTRLSEAGAVLWDPPIYGRLDSSGEVMSFRLKAVSGTGLLTFWSEDDSPDRRLELQHRNWSGTALWGSDVTVSTGEEHRTVYDLIGLTDGSVLVAYTEGEDENSPLMTRRLPAGSASLGPPVTVEEGDGMADPIRLIGAPLADGGSFLIFTRFSMAGGWMSRYRLDSTGASLWPEGLWLPSVAGRGYRLWPRFVRGSGSGGSFGVVWTDARDRRIHPYARNFLDPAVPSGTHDVKLDTTRQPSGVVRSAQATDGSHAAVWVEATEGLPRIMAGWYEADWSPRWGAPMVLVPESEFPEGPELDMVLDSAGRAMVGWIDEEAGIQAIYIQGFDSAGAIVFPGPTPVSSVPAGADLKNLDLAALSDGAIGAVWLDDRGGDDRARCQRISSTGAPQWVGDYQISELGAVTDYRVAAEGVGTELHTICVTGSVGNMELYFRAIDAAGCPCDPSVAVSGVYAGIYNLAVARFGEGLVTAFLAHSVDLGVYSQRISGGVGLWADPKVNTIVPILSDGLDILQTGPDRCMVTYELSNAIFQRNIYLQELDGSGVKSYISDLPLVHLEPQYIAHAGAGSSRLNDGSPVYWAFLEAMDDAAGGSLRYYLSNDGGASWEIVAPGEVRVFPTAGSDLRWGVDLWGEPTRQLTPVVTRVETSWDELPIGADLLLNRSVFQAGDLFSLRLRLSNSGSPRSLEEYLVLAVGGDYWFWPGWTETVDNRTETLPTGVREEPILEFTWPTGAGAMAGLAFYVGVVEPGTANVLSPIDVAEFSFQ